MLYKYNLNKNTFWSSLPWQKIYTKILAVQRKIYVAAKCYNLDKVYKLQKYLLNSNESKIFSIKYIIENIYIFSFLKYKKKFFISNKEKLEIFQNIYNSKKIFSHNFNFLINQVKQHLIYLSIETEYLAKFVCNYDCYKKVLKNNLSNFFNYFYYKSNNVIKKIKVSEYLEKIDNRKYFCINCIYTFIKSIYFSKLYWYLHYQNVLKLGNKRNRIDIFQILINLKNYNHFKLIQNSLLYNKLNKFINIKDNFVFATKNKKLFYLAVNKIIFYKLKKRYNNNLYKYSYFVLNSKYIHKTFHIVQIKSIYIKYCI